MFDSSGCVKDQDGNPVPFAALYDTHFQEIFRYVLHRVGNVAVAEDLTSQTFFKALKGMWRFRFTGVPMGAWFYRIATNEVNSYLRLRQKGRDGDLDDTTEPETDLAGPEDELRAAEAELSQYHVFNTLTEVIRELKPLDQTLITLRYLEEKPYDEIAQIVGKRTGTVTVRTHRALEKLQKLLIKRGIDHETIRGSFEGRPETGYSGGSVSHSVAT